MALDRPSAISIIVPAARQLSITWKHVLTVTVCQNCAPGS